MEAEARYLDIVGSRVDCGVERLEQCVWWNDAMLENQDGLNNARKTACSFKVANIGLDGATALRLE